MKKARRLRTIFIIYWFMLAYIIAALIFWFIELNDQNNQLTALRTSEVVSTGISREAEIREIESLKKRKTAQYIGEGATFLLLIVAAAIYIYRAVNRQLKQNIQQQNFMMAITHELKTPIAVAHLNIETLLKRKLNDEQQQRILTTTLQETNRLNTLCNNILLTSQFDSGGYKITKENIRFDLLVNNSIQEYSNRFPDRKIVSDIREVSLNGDEMLLKIAINNLLDNAFKYSPKDSVVNIRLYKNNDAIFEISDEGPGISDEEKKMVFKKFYRVGNEATKKAKGTGLGLHLTERIVATHKGTVSVEDNKPSGSRFIIKLQVNGE